jgi:hypothetical protein
MIWKNKLDLFRDNKLKHLITVDSYFDVHQKYDDVLFLNNLKDIIDTNTKLWQTAIKNTTGQKILMATISGGFSHRPLMMMDAILSIALTLRNHQVDAFLCDHALPVCLKAEYAYIKPEVIHHAQLSQTLCKGCFKDSSFLYSQLGLTNQHFSKYVNTLERAEAKKIAQNISIKLLPTYEIEGILIGKHAMAGTMRYFAHANPSNNELGEETSRRFLEASIITYYATKKLLENNQYDKICITHGIFSPHGVIADLGKKFGIPVICWGISYQKQRFFFTHDNPLQYLLHEPTAAWENMQWSEKHENKIMNYLNSRWNGNKDWLTIAKERKNITFDEFAKEKKIDLSKPIIGLLTNIIWEAVAEYKSRIFPDMLTWIKETINYFSKRKDLQLLIRIHPAESQGNASRQLALDEINKLFKKIPENVFIINSDNNVSTYEAMEYCDAAIIYQTQAGIELAAQGIPIIVAGDAWIRYKNIVLEPNSKDEYLKQLDQLPFKQRLSNEKILRAKKYAYHAFFRKMIPLAFFEETNDWMLYKPTIKKLDELLPNCDLGLDVICDGIINNTSFVYPADEYET